MSVTAREDESNLRQCVIDDDDREVHGVWILGDQDLDGAPIMLASPEETS